MVTVQSFSCFLAGNLRYKLQQLLCDGVFCCGPFDFSLISRLLILLRLRRSFKVSIGFVEASCPSRWSYPYLFVRLYSFDHWNGFRCPMSSPC